MSELKTKQVFNEPLKTSFDEQDKSEVSPDLGAQQLFTEQEKFVPVAPQVEAELDGEAEQQLEQVLKGLSSISMWIKWLKPFLSY